jgi:AraC-like DNA-binding protein
VAELLPKGKATVPNVARALGVSTGTFTRRIAEEGTNYAALLDQFRRDLAMRYLENKDLELRQIAWLLGYSEVSSFNHAFHRWTGASPKSPGQDCQIETRFTTLRPPWSGTSYRNNGLDSVTTERPRLAPLP